jgi:tetratricopeptide (TPR) repeat protein
MAFGAAAGVWSLGRACARIARGWPKPAALLAAGLILANAAAPARAQNEPVKGEAVLSAAGGFARLTIKLADDVDSQVMAAGSIVVIRFRRPVEIPVGRLSDAVPDYISSARVDPDGTAIRLSLARKVTINTMTAGERVFVDFLPDGWSGPPPGLPQEVVRELSERARAAERALRLQRANAEAKKRAPVRVRASVQPTFVRFVFEVPDGVGVSSVLNDQKLTLLFNAPLTFDLADAKVSAPPNVAAINQKLDGASSTVEAELIGDVDVRSFREDKNYVVDVAFQAEKPQVGAPRASAAPAEPAQSAPVAAAPVTPAAPAPAAQAAAPEPAPHASETAPPTSETIAQQARIEIKPETAARIVPPPPPLATQLPKQAPAVIAEGSKPAPSVTSAPVTEAPKLAAGENSAEAASGDKSAKLVARRDSDGLRLSFSFAQATPAAMFRRSDAVWLVFDSTKPLDVEPIRVKGGALIGDVSRMDLPQGQAIRIRLNRPQIPSLSGGDAGNEWAVTFADTMLAPPQPLMAIRNITDPALANVTVPLAKPGLMHRFTDPDAGDGLLVVTAPLPLRGFIKRQDFVELSLLESIHGVAVHPNSDDVKAEIATDKILLGRPGGLTLSSADVAAERANLAVRPIFDIGEWREHQAGNFMVREDALIKAMGAAAPDVRPQARLDLARFYMARGLYPEAKGVADFVLSEVKPGFEESAALMLRAVANILIDRPEQALKDFANPVIGNSYDLQLWRALAAARLGKWAEAREKFKNVEFAIASLPVELQRIVLTEAMRASLEVKDYSGAARRRSDLDVVIVTPEMKPSIAILRGRLAEALGHDRDAQNEYRIAMRSKDREAASEGKLLDLILRQKRAEIAQPDLLRDLETLAMTWRGGEVEVKALQMMAHIYADTGRYNEALMAVRTATKLEPNSEISRQGQDMAAALFAQLFLSPKGDELPPIEALGMFFEFRELTPIGRRGDEMIRRLADRLVSIDLLDQAAELLQYQIDKRLEGAARAQVAARLATVYLTHRKPDRAVAALRSTRIADLSGELRQQRLLLEARAQSDVGRHDLGLDIISNLSGREAVRLRSDIYWASRKWRESAEQIELYYADRWRDFKPLNAVEKGDVIRAVVGYALADDAIGLARFREKYAPLMSGEADRFAFETASAPGAVTSAEFAQIAKMAAGVDTLDGFLREMKQRFPDATARAPLPPQTVKGEPVHTGSLPEIVGLKRVVPAR